MKMRSCSAIKFIFNLFPIKRLQYFLLQRHLLRCSECKSSLIDKEEARAVTYQKENIRIREDFWQKFDQRLKADEKEKKVSLLPGWKWAIGTTAFFALAVVLYFAFTPLLLRKKTNLAAKLQINYINLYEEPAQAFIFQTQDAKRTFIWVEKRIKGETQ
jgi:anti-sigma-K factor RskA